MHTQAFARYCPSKRLQQVTPCLFTTYYPPTVKEICSIYKEYEGSDLDDLVEAAEGYDGTRAVWAYFNNIPDYDDANEDSLNVFFKAIDVNDACDTFCFCRDTDFSAEYEIGAKYVTHKRDVWIITPLTQAIKYGSSKLVEQILNHGANPNIIVNDCSCLDYLESNISTAEEAQQIAILLMKHGMVMYKTNKVSKALLHNSHPKMQLLLSFLSACEVI